MWHQRPSPYHVSKAVVLSGGGSYLHLPGRLAVPADILWWWMVGVANGN